MTTPILDPLPGFTFGCDPELFLMNKEGEFVSAAGLVPGTKEEPYKVPGGAVQVDGMAAEFNIDPASTFSEFNQNINTVLKHLRRIVPKDLRMVPVPSATFSEKVWNESPEEAKVLGCTPDFNAWTGEINPVPNTDDDPRTRCAGGHLHVGWTEDADFSDVNHITNCCDLVRQFDWYLGGWSLRVDNDSTRRKLYGKAGAMRVKPYGVEYRVLSNFWLTTYDRRLAVWNRMQKAIQMMSSNFIPENKYGVLFKDQLIQSINTSQRDSLLEKHFRFPLQSILD